MCQTPEHGWSDQRRHDRHADDNREELGVDHARGAADTGDDDAHLAARSLGRREAVFVGVGMIPRGEVGIVVAGIGRTAGVIDAELFAVIVGMSVVTTLITPPLLARLARR